VAMGTLELCFDKIGEAKVGPNEGGVTEINIIENSIAEVKTTKISMAEVQMNRKIDPSPCIPYTSTLPN
jgi:hypothetical protein